jgi:hypothetical protein
MFKFNAVKFVKNWIAPFALGFDFKTVLCTIEERSEMQAFPRNAILAAIYLIAHGFFSTEASAQVSAFDSIQTAPSGGFVTSNIDATCTDSSLNLKVFAYTVTYSAVGTTLTPYGAVVDLTPQYTTMMGMRTYMGHFKGSGTLATGRTYCLIRHKYDGTSYYEMKRTGFFTVSP